jgi:hypothetical protein
MGVFVTMVIRGEKMNSKTKIKLMMEKRDAKILADLLGGQSVADIALREEVTPQRIYQIGNAGGWVSKREIAKRTKKAAEQIGAPQ